VLTELLGTARFNSESEAVCSVPAPPRPDLWFAQQGRHCSLTELADFQTRLPEFVTVCGNMLRYRLGAARARLHAFTFPCNKCADHADSRHGA